MRVIVYLHQMFFRVLTVFAGLSHLFYGITALFDPFFIQEYARYGFSNQRIIIGFVQAVLGLFLLSSFYFPKLKFFGALGLSIMMAGAFGTRLYIGDSAIQSTPSIVYFVINLIILVNNVNSRK